VGNTNAPGIETKLLAAADVLWNNADAAEYKRVVLETRNGTMEGSTASYTWWEGKLRIYSRTLVAED
jgi:hypothetical protein